MRNSIQSLTNNGCLVTAKEEILQLFANDLQTKYSKKKLNVDPTSFLKKSVKSKLTDKQKVALDSPLSLSELHT